MWSRPWLPVLAVLLTAASARAGSISITTTQTAKLDGSTLLVQIGVGNSGDEAAYAVTPLVRFGDSVARGTRVESLAPNAHVQDEVKVDTGPLAAGTWTYVVGVDYTDANQYPFQAIQAGRLTVGNPPPAKVAVTAMEVGKLAKGADLEIRVKNLEAVDRTVEVRLMTPDGIEAAPATSQLPLGPWQEKTLAVELTNRTALAGSRYPVFAAVSYEQKGVHEAVLGQTVVEIVSSETFVDRFGGSLWIGAAALGALFLLLIVVRSVRR